MYTQPGRAQDLGTSGTDTTGSVEVTIGFNDNTGVDGVHAYAVADLTTLDLLDDCAIEASVDGECWAHIGGVLTENGYTIGDSSDDCSPDDYDAGYCGYPWSIGVDFDSGFVVNDKYEIYGYPGLCYYDDNYDVQCIALSFSDGYDYLDFWFDAYPPKVSDLTPNYGVLGTSGQIDVTGDYFLDDWPPSYVPATLPAASSGLSYSLVGKPTDSQLIVQYKIDANAPTGNRQFTLTNRFGTSSPVTFIVADASPTFTNPNVGTLVAGNQYSINISGANFGKNPQVSETGPAGVTFNLTVSGAANTITGTITLASGASTGPIIITLTSEGASGNGFIGPETPTVTATGAVQGLPAGAPFFVLRPSYASATGSSGDSTGNCSSNTPLTSANETVVVGQQINLTGCAPANGGIAVLSASWTQVPLLASNAVGGFSVTENHTNYQFTRTLIAVPSAPTCASTQSCDFPTFYFITPGTYTFTYQYKLVNGSISAVGTAVFTVQGPTPNTNGHYVIDNSYVGDPGYPFTPGPIAVYAPGERSLTAAIMASGNGASTTAIALTVDSSVKMPSGYSDTGWLFVQVINNISYSLRSNPSSTPFNLQPGLDTSYPYDFGTLFSDSPGTPLDTNNFGSATYTVVGEKSTSLGFTVYLMWDPEINPANNNDCSMGSLGGSLNAPNYTPSNCSSIPVPLDAVSWGYSADAVKTMNPLQNTTDGKYANSWYLADGYPVTPNYAPAVYPFWSCTENGAQFNQSISGTCALQ
jgi:hypothetical protein